MFEPYYSLLPPHWKYREDSNTYFNEVTQEETPDHPITIFINARQAVLNLPPNDPIGIEIERIQYAARMTASLSRQGSPKMTTAALEDTQAETQVISETFGTEADAQIIRSGNNDEPDRSSNEEVVDQGEGMSELQLPSGKYYEYHCQWSERDLFGKVSLYGLTFRYYEQSQKTLIRFDGLLGDWVYSVLQGPYGPLEHIDFFIGAKIKVFGRQVTISSASGSAIRWIEAQRKRLEKQQERFREKILAVGQVPCVKPKAPDVVRHITRGDSSEAGHTDLRKLMMVNAKLGEQLVSLGLCDQL